MVRAAILCVAGLTAVSGFTMPLAPVRSSRTSLSMAAPQTPAQKAAAAAAAARSAASSAAKAPAKTAAKAVPAAKAAVSKAVSKAAPAAKSVAAKAPPAVKSVVAKAAPAAKAVAKSFPKTPAAAKPFPKTPASRPAQPRRVSPNAPTGAGMSIQFGSDVEAPFWDPAGLAVDKSDETISWYRSAELKHGRIAMLACLGTWINGAGYSLPDEVFSGTVKSFDALAKVAAERPGALIQITLAIAAIEVLSTELPAGEFPGDLGFDPLDQKKVYEAKGGLDELRLKELKNGRLAMLGIFGMWYQEYLTGQGVFEQFQADHLNPFGDGQGYF